VYPAREGAGSGVSGSGTPGWLANTLPVYTLSASAYESGEVAHG
jgi:hypothetical protein